VFYNKLSKITIDLRDMWHTIRRRQYSTKSPCVFTSVSWLVSWSFC